MKFCENYFLLVSSDQILEKVRITVKKKKITRYDTPVQCTYIVRQSAQILSSVKWSSGMT